SNNTTPPHIYPLSLHDALPILSVCRGNAYRAAPAILAGRHHLRLLHQAKNGGGDDLGVEGSAPAQNVSQVPGPLVAGALVHARMRGGSGRDELVAGGADGADEFDERVVLRISVGSVAHECPDIKADAT